MRFKPSLLGLSFVAVALVAASACSDQAEGERCSTDNNDSDCASGLRCQLLSGLGRTGDTATAGVCCPISGPATTAACTAQQGVIPADGGPNGRADAHVSTTPDTGTTPVPGPEASVPTDAAPAAHD